MSEVQAVSEPVVIVIFGASGDLTQRMLAPALHSLACEGLLHPQTRVVGMAIDELTDQAFRDRVYSGLVNYARLKPGVCELWSQAAQRWSYLPGDFADAHTYRRLGDRLAALYAEAALPHNCLFYLATPPSMFPLIVAQLAQAGLNRDKTGWTRIVIEKPFGRDLESALQLDRSVLEAFDESQIYRIDHFLGKETVQNLLVLRFANSIFEPLWNRNYVDHVQITMAEAIGVGARAGYYDQAGVLRDMFQNHILQLLCLMAMEPIASFDAKALRDEKLKVLQAVRDTRPEDCVVGQYRGYREEPGVAPDSRTATYAAVQLYVDNWRWQGVPFFLRSGKKLHRRETDITIQFGNVPHLPFAEYTDPAPNRISICIQPNEGMRLRLAAKLPGAGMRLAAVAMEFHYKDYFGERALPDAYERLLLDALNGDATLFTRNDEIEEAWKIIDPLLADRVPVIYEPGSMGPHEADELLLRDGHAWVEGCSSNEAGEPSGYAAGSG
ncbi:MAG: glucose-6-phosphate dehydrogenase [Chloroflexi bacterium]|nr:glucose-6-phosphate dehydrogenase [Chloroflexota bacterium]